MRMTLYISDLDGTLLRNNGELSPFSRVNLSRLVEEGVSFTVASARSVAAIRKILSGVPIHLPVIEFNGAFISDMQTGRHHMINAVDPVIVHEIYNRVKGYGCESFISTYNGQEDCLYYHQIENDGMLWYHNDRLLHKDHRLRYTQRIKDTFREQVICFTIIDRKHRLEELAAEIEETYDGKVEVHLFENQYSPGWYWLTIHDHKATKDQAIRRLVDEFGFDFGRLTVFGDQTNDIKMFKAAARSIAVDNACDELKQYATEIIGANESDSVVRFIMAEQKYYNENE